MKGAIRKKRKTLNERKAAEEEANFFVSLNFSISSNIKRKWICLEFCQKEFPRPHLSSFAFTRYVIICSLVDNARRWSVVVRRCSIWFTGGIQRFFPPYFCVFTFLLSPTQKLLLFLTSLSKQPTKKAGFPFFFIHINAAAIVMSIYGCIDSFYWLLFFDENKNFFLLRYPKPHYRNEIRSRTHWHVQKVFDKSDKIWIGLKITKKILDSFLLRSFDK